MPILLGIAGAAGAKKLGGYLQRHQPPWYRKLEQLLLPVQPIVIGILLVVVAISVLLIWKGPRWLRTLWAVYLASP